VYPNGAYMNCLSLKHLQSCVAYQREESAYRKLFLHYYHNLSHFAQGFVKTKEAAEEVVSDVMLKVWSMQAHLAQIDNLTVYLYRATRNHSLNYLRSNQKRQHILDVTDENFGYEMQTPETFLLENEWKEMFRQAILSLPPKCQMVYKLIREDGFSYRETARIMEISENTVDRHLNNALHKLTYCLKSYVVQDDY
jgi:RNA polymerase sigma-70 factor (family 1)